MLRREATGKNKKMPLQNYMLFRLTFFDLKVIESIEVSQGDKSGSDNQEDSKNYVSIYFLTSPDNSLNNLS